MSPHQDVPPSLPPDVEAGIRLREAETLDEASNPPPSADVSCGLAGRYQVQGRIGNGGMGEVFRGRDPDLGRDLALKVLLTESGEDVRAVERFREEARIGAQLQHPGVVPLYDLGTLGDGRPFFTMKLVK